jgi:hypothetical protein
VGDLPFNLLEFLLRFFGSCHAESVMSLPWCCLGPSGE